ncbi:MAG TPA: threonine synthase [Mycobacteriales bacterium]|nr:threonine synthase [Mycobacteriales bacterium]
MRGPQDRGYSRLTGLRCSECGQQHDATVPQNLSSCCSLPLLADYDLAAVADLVSPADLAGRPPSLWRYHELLPVLDQDNVVSLGEGMTPLVPLPNLGRDMGVPRLRVKDEAAMPTGSFKARGAAVGVSKARELGVTSLAMPTNGNAGAAWASYCARAGIASLVVMPVDAPRITREECVAAGAELYCVDGLISDAGRIVGRVVAAGNVFDASTLKEPYRIEGKKTMGLEIVEQLGWRVPDVIVYPTGGGVGLIGIFKALTELRALGWIDAKTPRLVAVQAAGCAPIVTAFDAGQRHAKPWPDANTVAFGINVPAALGDFLILDALRATGGTAVAVSDEAIRSEAAACARSDGLLPCPEGAATLAGVRRLRAEGWIGGSEEVVVLNTGAGTKYPGVVPANPVVLAADQDVPVRTPDNRTGPGAGAG